MMGSACSMTRSSRRLEDDPFRRTSGRPCAGRKTNSSGQNVPSHSSLRHSVVTTIPDPCIAKLYPLEDNYILEDDGTKSPKSLAQLATDAVCRSLVYLDGALPPGLPTDVVRDIVESLDRHAAWTPTTLGVLCHCELDRLNLTSSRGVTDAWIHALTTTPPPPTTAPTAGEPRPREDEAAVLTVSRSATMGDEHMDVENDHASSSSSCGSTTSYMTATSSPYAMPQPLTTTTTTNTVEAYMSSNPEGMIIEREEFCCQNHPTGDAFDDDDDFTWKKPMAEPHAGLVSTRMITQLDLSGSQHLTDKGLIKLNNLEQLKEARLEHCHSIVGRGLVVFAASHQLCTLSLAHCRRLTDESIAHLSHLMALESLSLAGCRCLTDRSMAALADLYSLRHLDLSQCDLLTDAGVEQLENLESLEELSLGWCRQITNRGLRCLVDQPGRSTGLRRLCLARCSISDDGIACLSRLAALEELNLNGCSNVGSTALGDAIQGLKHLERLEVSYCPGIIRSGWQGKINNIKSLDLCYANVRDSHIARLTSLPCLEELNLDSCLIGDSSLAHLADSDVIPKLSSLDLSDTNITDAGMAKIAKFKQMTHLSLFYCNISNRGVRHIAQLKELVVLNLDSRDVSDEGIYYLRELPKLRSLDIFSGRISNTGCEYISCIKTLESLELCGGGIGDAGCAKLATLSELTHLNLSQNEGISNQGASALASSLSKLKTLNLSNTGVTSGALRFFSGLTQLESLALYGCSGMEYSVRLDWLKSRLPNLKCLRLNNTSEEEGMVLVDLSEESSSDEEEAAASAVWSNEDNAMEDAPSDRMVYNDQDEEYSDHD